MLRLLKSETVNSLRVVRSLVGYSVGQLARWWECYRTKGLAALLKQQKPVGKPSQMTPEAWAGLMSAMRKGHNATMKDARDDLEREWASVQKRQVVVVALGRSIVCLWKTGSRRHKKANDEQQAAFQKTSGT